jgi:hypothetical protein
MIAFGKNLIVNNLYKILIPFQLLLHKKGTKLRIVKLYAVFLRFYNLNEKPACRVP